MLNAVRNDQLAMLFKNTVLFKPPNPLKTLKCINANAHESSKIDKSLAGRDCAVVGDVEFELPQIFWISQGDSWSCEFPDRKHIMSFLLKCEGKKVAVVQGDSLVVMVDWSLRMIIVKVVQSLGVQFKILYLAVPSDGVYFWIVATL